MDLIRSARRDTDGANLPQTFENLTNVIGFRRDGNCLEQGEPAHAASFSVIENSVKSIELFGVESGGQNMGGLLAGPRPSRDPGNERRELSQAIRTGRSDIAPRQSS